MTPSVMAPTMVLTSLRCWLASSSDQLACNWLPTARAAAMTRASVWDVAVSTEPTMPSTPMIRPRTSWMGAPAVTMPCKTRK